MKGYRMVDLLLAADFDLLIVNGDFSPGQASEQHQQLILVLEPGSLKSSPSCGVGLGSYVNDDQPSEVLKKSIQQQFEADGMKISKLRVDSLNNIEIKAEY
jgi:hypothetical protein